MPKMPLAIAVVALLYAAPQAFAEEASDHEAHHPAPTQDQTPETSPDGARDGQGGMGVMPCPMMRGMMGQGMMNSGPKGDQSASSIAFDAIRMKMGRDMAITYTGDADADFLKAMAPHHQGAIDMAKTVLVFGKDPEVRKLAEAIIKQQESEIATMKRLTSKPQ